MMERSFYAVAVEITRLTSQKKVRALRCLFLFRWIQT